VGISPPSSDLRVLVADDEPHIGRIIKMKLEQGPFEVTLAYDGREALEILDSIPDLSLVLLDVMMPYLGGLDVLERMRATDRWRNMPCIILTAAGEQEHQRRALQLGANDFVTKPFSPKKLYARAVALVGLAGGAGAEATPPPGESWT
jgi:two-component system alkaline phosphatase synthesis response regulator PhoP